MAKKTKKKQTKKSVLKKPTKKLNKKSVTKKSVKPKTTAKKPLQAAKKTSNPTTNKKAAVIDLSKIISPLDDRILVQLESAERITAGGLIIPDTVSITGNQNGVVVAVGRGHRDNKGRIRPLDLKVGDRILLPEYAGDSVQIVGQDVKILRESEILGVLTK